MSIDPCSWHGCDLCCRDAPVTLSEADVERLAKVGVDTSTAVGRSGDHLILIHLKRACILLRDGRCSQYHARPDLCRAFPFVAMPDGTGGRSELCPHRREFKESSRWTRLAMDAIDIQDDEADSRIDPRLP